MKKDIPEQQEGSEMDVAEHILFSEEASAKECYTVARKRLLKISGWDQLCGFVPDTFTLTDASGKELNRTAIEGDYIRINISGPETRNRDGSDWLKIELVQEETFPATEMITIRTRPSANPLPTDQESARFFKDKATFIFKVIRKDKKVYAEVYGRNESPASDTPILINNIRNVLAGWSAGIGFSYPQWKSLVTALLKPEKS